MTQNVYVRDNYVFIPIPGTNEVYEIPLENIRTREDWGRWVNHLATKRWITFGLLRDAAQAIATHLSSR